MANIENLKERFKKLTEKRDSCKVQKVELDTKIKITKEELEKKTKILKEEYGLDSVEDAEKELSRLESEIDSELSECEEFLKGYEV